MDIPSLPNRLNLTLIKTVASNSKATLIQKSYWMSLTWFQTLLISFCFLAMAILLLLLDGFSAEVLKLRWYQHACQQQQQEDLRQWLQMSCDVLQTCLWI